MVKIKIWPDQAAKHLETVFGEGTVKAPMSYSRTKRGLPFFQIKTGEERRPDHVIKTLQRIGIPNSILADGYRDRLGEHYKGVLLMRIPASGVESILKLVHTHEDDINKALTEDIPELKTVKLSAKADWDAEKINAMTYGIPAESLPHSAPEMSAYAAHIMSKSDELVPELMGWFIPQQVPGPMAMAITPEGKIGFATPEQRAEQEREYEAHVAKRMEMLDKQNPVDRIFDNSTGQINEFPGGTIHQMIIDGKRSSVGTGTYWNPEESRFYIIHAELDRAAALRGELGMHRYAIDPETEKWLEELKAGAPD